MGFAYDISGTGRRVLKGGYGLYFDGTGINTHYNIFIQNNRPITFDATLVNTAIGVGQMATYRLGIDPLPEKPTIPIVSAGQENGRLLVRSEHYRSP